MAIEAYKIYVELVMDQAKIVGPLNEMLRAMQRIEDEQKVIQTGLNDMAAGLRGNARLAQALARSMREVADASKAAATATRSMRVPVGGGLGSAAAASVAPAAPTASGRNAERSPLLLGGPASGRYATSAPLLLGGPGRSGTAGGGGIIGGGGRNGAGGGDVPRLGGPNGGSRMPPINPGGGGSGGANGSGDPRSSGDRGVNAGHLLGVAATAIFGVELLSSAVEAFVKPSYDLQAMATQIQARTASSNAAMARTINAARTQQYTIPGTNVPENLSIYSQAFALTQNPDEAAALTPVMARLGVAFATLHPQGGTYSAQTETIMKDAEFLGLLTHIDPKTGKAAIDPKTGKPAIDPGGVTRLANMLLYMELASNDAISTKDSLAFYRSSGNAGASMDIDQIASMVPVIQALGPRRAGQALQASAAQFQSGKMSQGLIKVLASMGIVKDPSKFVPMGIGQAMLLPGAIDEKTVMEAIKTPVTFNQDVLVPAVDKWMKKYYGEYINGNDATKQKLRSATGLDFSMDEKSNAAIMENVILAQISSRQPGGVFQVELNRNRALSDRDAAAVGRLSKTDPIATLSGSPLVTMTSFTGALNDLLAQFGSPAMAGALVGLKGLTAAMNALNKAGNENPDLAKKVGFQAGVGAGGSVGLSLLYLAGKGVSKFGAPSVGGLLKGSAKLGATGLAAGMAEMLLDDAITYGLNKVSPGFSSQAAKGQAAIDANSGRGSPLWELLNLGPKEGLMGGYSPLQTIGRDVHAIGSFLGISGMGASHPPPKPPAPIATKASPLPVIIMNPGAIANGVNAHNDKLFSQEPAIHTGPSFAATPPWPGRPGGAP